MRLTSFADYSLRVLIFLGVHRDRRVQRSEIAAGFGISENHLGKVVNSLAQAGYVDAKRGPGGGLCLACEPSEIRIGEVVATFEPDFRLVECFDEETNTCPISPICGLAPILGEAESAFQAVLEKYTLEDVLSVRGKSRYRALLGDG